MKLTLTFTTGISQLPARLLQFSAILLASCLMLASQVHADETASVENFEATRVVDELHGTLLEAMQGGDTLGYAGRYELLAPVIAESFDTQMIARVILGRHWDELDDDQRDEFIRIFNELSAATYASRFNSHAGETFEHNGIEPLNRGRILVRTKMLQGNGDSVRFDYLMHAQDENWYIISVVAEGVNDLSLKRAEFGSVIRARGFDGLIQELRNKITEYEQAIS